LKEEQRILNEFVRVIVPSNYSSISDFIETILSICQTNFSTIKTMNDRNSQEMKQTIEELMKHFQNSLSN
jgi:hypothetical protein